MELEGLSAQSSPFEGPRLRRDSTGTQILYTLTNGDSKHSSRIESRTLEGFCRVPPLFRPEAVVDVPDTLHIVI